MPTLHTTTTLFFPHSTHMHPPLPLLTSPPPSSSPPKVKQLRARKAARHRSPTAEERTATVAATVAAAAAAVDPASQVLMFPDILRSQQQFDQLLALVQAQIDHGQLQQCVQLLKEAIDVLGPYVLGVMVLDVDVLWCCLR